MRTLYDSTNAADIPPGSQLVAGYVDGSSAWSASDWQRFPGRTLVRVCIWNNSLNASVIDIEPGNNDARGAVPFVAAKWARGEAPTVYCFSDGGPVGYRISDVRAACDAAGVRRPLIWIAQWDNDPSTFDPAGDTEIVGKQYANPTFTGGHYDASVVVDFWPGVDKKEDHMASPTFSGQSNAVINLRVGEVATISGIWYYPTHGGNRPINGKVVSYAQGARVVMLYPPVDPDADPTLDTSAQPALFLVATLA